MNALKGLRLHASDGYIGRVDDVHFDGRTWAVSQICAETRPHLIGHRVLVPADALGHVDWVDRSIPVHQDREEVNHDQDADEYSGSFRDLAAHWMPFVGALGASPEPKAEEDTNIRSMNQLNGYEVRATDSEVGHVADFILDDDTWRVRMAVVELSSDLFGRRVLLPVERIPVISFESQTMYIDVPSALFVDAPEVDVLFLAGKNAESVVSEHYRQPAHSV
jgi:sporulation protein YlmC with PRC-barrel domain